jgi:hypothetical protein
VELTWRLRYVSKASRNSHVKVSWHIYQVSHRFFQKFKAEGTCDFRGTYRWHCDLMRLLSLHYIHYIRESRLKIFITHTHKRRRTGEEAFCSIYTTQQRRKIARGFIYSSKYVSLYWHSCGKDYQYRRQTRAYHKLMQPLCLLQQTVTRQWKSQGWWWPFLQRCYVISNKTSAGSAHMVAILRIHLVRGFQRTRQDQKLCTLKCRIHN